MAKDFDADFDREEPEGRSSQRYRPNDREDDHEGHEEPAPKKEKSPVLLIFWNYCRRAAPLRRRADCHLGTAAFPRTSKGS